MGFNLYILDYSLSMFSCLPSWCGPIFVHCVNLCPWIVINFLEFSLWFLPLLCSLLSLSRTPIRCWTTWIDSLSYLSPIFCLCTLLENFLNFILFFSFKFFICAKFFFLLTFSMYAVFLSFFLQQPYVSCQTTQE